MRNILLILFLLVSFVSFGQPGYTLINHRYNWKTGAFTELTIPASSTHALATGQWRRAGAVMVDTSGADSGFYYMGENQVWHRLVKSSESTTFGRRFGVTSEDNTAAQNRTYSSTGIHDFTFSTLDDFTVTNDNRLTLTTTKGNAIGQIDINAFGADMTLQYSSLDLDSSGFLILNEYSAGLGASDAGAGASGLVDVFPTYINFVQSSGNYRFAGLQTRTDTSVWKPMVWRHSDSTIAKLQYWPSGGGPTPTLQQVLDAGSNIANNIEVITTGTGRLEVSGSSVPFYGITSATGLSAGLFRSNATSTTNNSDILTFERLVDGGVGASGIGATLTWAIEDAAGSANNQRLRLYYLDATGGAQNSRWNFESLYLGAYDTVMQIQGGGIVRVNNNADTLATRAYARSVGGGGSISFGTSNQIPHMNTGGTDFDYDADFTWDGATLLTNSGVGTTGNIFVVPDGGSTYAMAQDASPGGGEHYLRFFRTSNVHLLEASHPSSGEFTIRNVGAGPFQLQSASTQEIRLRPGETTTTVFTSSGQTFTFQSTNEVQSLFKDISAPSTPASGYGSLYTNSDKLNFKDDGGTVYILERLASGSRTPSATNGTNVSSSTMDEEHYIRVGNVVHVYGTMSVDCASASITSVIDLDLPIASDFTTVTDLSGIMTGAEAATASPSHGSASAETTNNRVTFTFTPRVDTSTPYRYSYSYQIL